MRRLLAVFVGSLMIVSCSGSDDAAPSATEPAPSTVGTETSVAAPTTDAAVETTDSTADITTETTSVTSDVVTSGAEPVRVAWTEIVPDVPDCACSDGSEFRFFERSGDPEKVMLFFEGGGACFSLETCDPNGTPTYTPTITDDVSSLAERRGLFDADNPENPVADWTIVFVPYCTGDVHIGDASHEYSPDVVIEHRGAVNAQAALDHLVATYPDPDQLLVTGESAGSVPTPLIAGLASDLLPDTRIVTLGDSSGAYPDVAAVNELIGNLWGTVNAIPDWPETAGVTLAEWSIPGLYVQAGRHAPDITFARFDYAFDQVQATFSALAGIGADAVVEGIDATEAEIEASGTDVAVYVAPGSEHTIIGGDEVYTMEVDGVRLIDWIRQLVTDAPPADVHCTVCD